MAFLARILSKDAKTKRSSTQSKAPNDQKRPSLACQSMRHEVSFRIAVVGAQGCGKSAIVRRYCANSFTEDPHPEDPLIFVELLEIAYQELRGQWLQRYLQGLHGAIVVFDISSQASLQAVDEWCAVLIALGRNKGSTGNSAAPRLPLLLFANKTDVGPLVASEVAIDKFAHDSGFHSWSLCSAKEGVGVKESLDNLLDAIVNQHRTEQPGQLASIKGGASQMRFQRASHLMTENMGQNEAYLEAAAENDINDGMRNDASCARSGTNSSLETQMFMQFQSICSSLEVRLSELKSGRSTEASKLQHEVLQLQQACILATEDMQETQMHCSEEQQVVRRGRVALFVQQLDELAGAVWQLEFAAVTEDERLNTSSLWCDGLSLGISQDLQAKPFEAFELDSPRGMEHDYSPGAQNKTSEGSLWQMRTNISALSSSISARLPGARLDQPKPLSESSAQDKDASYHTKEEQLSGL